MQWKHKNDKMQFYYNEGRDQWVLKKQYANGVRNDPIKIRELFDHYRNCKVALPRKSRNGICVQSHPLHKYLTKSAPPTLMAEIYDGLKNTQIMEAVNKLKTGMAG
jgi:hypothetical protein